MNRIRLDALPRAAAIMIAFSIGAIVSPAYSHAAQPEADTAYRAGTGLLNRGLHEPAAAEFRAFLKNNPRHAKAASARYALAVCLVQLGQHGEAARELDAVVGIKDFEFAPDALFLSGQCAAATGNDADAARWFRQVFADHPQYKFADSACSLMGESLYRAGKPKEAREAFTTLSERWPRSASRERAALFLALCDAGDADQKAAAERLAKARAEWPTGELAPQRALLEAQCRHRLGESREAISLYTVAAASNLDQVAPDAFLGLAQLQRQAGDTKAASRALDEVLTRFPTSAAAPAANIEKARVELDQDKPDDALRTLSAAAPNLDKNLADDAAYWAARCELKRGDFAKASDRLAAAIKNFPDSQLRAEMLFDRAVALARAGDESAAIDAYAQIEREFPAHDLASEAAAGSAQLLYRAANYQEASDACRRFLKSQPNHAKAPTCLLLLGESEYLLGRYAEAEKAAGQYVQLYPTDPRAAHATIRRGLALARLDRPADAEPVLMQALAQSGAIDPALKRSALAVLGDTAFATSRWADAEKWFTQLVKSPDADADLAVPLLKLGLSLQRQGRAEEAITAYDRLLKELPNAAQATQARFERGQALYELSRLDDAAKAFREVLDAPRATDDASPFASHAARYLGAIASKQGRPDDAADLLARAADLGGASGVYDAELGFERAAALLSAGKFADADAAFASFVTENPSHAKADEARANRAIALSRLGSHAAALELIDSLTRSSARLPDELSRALDYERAWLLAETGDLESAVKTYEKLLASRPTGTLRDHATLDLARLKVRAGEHADALRLLDDLVLSQGADQALSADAIEQRLYLRGVCESKLGRAADAAKTLHDFAAKYPKSPLVPSVRMIRAESLLKAGRSADAADELRKVIEASNDPELRAPALLRLGDALVASQKWAASEEAFTRFLSEFSDHELWFQAQFGIGWSCENQGRHDGAIAAYTPVVERHKGPTAARAQFQIGECYFAMKKLDLAVRELLKTDILFAYPEWSAASLYEAGRCLAESGKHADAKRQFEDVVRRFPDTNWAKLSKERIAHAAPALLPGKAPNVANQSR